MILPRIDLESMPQESLPSLKLLEDQSGQSQESQTGSDGIIDWNAFTAAGTSVKYSGFDAKCNFIYEDIYASLKDHKKDI
jgi:hypothetical protein